MDWTTDHWWTRSFNASSCTREGSLALKWGDDSNDSLQLRGLVMNGDVGGSAQPSRCVWLVSLVQIAHVLMKDGSQGR